MTIANTNKKKQTNYQYNCFNSNDDNFYSMAVIITWI